MGKIICYDVYPRNHNVDKMRKILVKKHYFTEKQNSSGVYFYKEIPACDSWHLERVLNSRGYKYRKYDIRYARSTDYRSTFFKNNKAPFRCAYCGRKLKGNALEVDHLIPINKAKNESSVRAFLQICGAKNINDAKNLVAACHKCNSKKSDKMGIWFVKGVIGRYRAVWIIRKIILILIAGLIAYMIFTEYPLLKNIVTYIESKVNFSGLT